MTNKNGQRSKSKKSEASTFFQSNREVLKNSKVNVFAGNSSLLENPRALKGSGKLEKIWQLKLQVKQNIT